jgi:hypothetical protein
MKPDSVSSSWQVAQALDPSNQVKRPGSQKYGCDLLLRYLNQYVARCMPVELTVAG